MEHRQLGKSDLRVSVVGLGCNNFGFIKSMGVAASRRVVDQALDSGINFLDTSDSYGTSEEILGEILSEGGRREKVVLATKVGSKPNALGEKSGASRGYVLAEVEESLRRLHTDRIDLYQIHYPDPKTHIEETLRAFDDLVKSGKVRYVGCSNFTARQLQEAENVAAEKSLTRFVSSQDEYSLLVRSIEGEHVALLEKYGMSEIPYFPLASGLLTGKYRHKQELPKGSRLAEKPGLAERYATEANLQRMEKLHSFAEMRGHTLLELAFSWLVAHPVVASVIAGATAPEQVKANAQAAGWKLTPEEMAEVDAIVEHGNS